ncbi:MAG: hypothetical protein JKX83_08250 [Pseudomonadales bacterium]|nr:hypothetical protein [Pseudomonadales bacterium]
MKLINNNIKWIMLVSGILTFSMVFAAITPQQALNSMFGQGLGDQPLAQMIVRNWGALIALIGAMLVYGAFNQANRKFALACAAISKSLFVGLAIYYGFGQQLCTAAVFDSVLVVIFVSYIFTASPMVNTE